MAASRTVRAMFAAALSSVIFGFSFLFSKMALAEAEPAVLLSCRFLFALLIMTLMLLSGRVKVSFRGKPVGLLLLLGLFEPVMYFICESYGILWSTATFSGVMIAMIPIVSLAFALIFLREKASAGQVLFSLLSIAGLVLLTMRATGEGSVRPRGILMLLGAIVSAVGFNLVSRRIAPMFSAFERTFMMFLMGAAFFTAYALVEGRTLCGLFAPMARPRFLAAVLYLGGMSSVGAFLLVNYGLTYLPVSRAAAFTNLTTVVSVLAGVAFYGESLPPVSALAVAMIIAGVWGVQKMALRND